ncbi:ribosomal protein L11 methylase [Singulisphaera acidiphila DSM 18658]|uniref:Ribosomal protein L11 methylase n=2 Tax=Singulisphaera acidiphila TaxID=466153 RepID=L0DHH8_SINAD|nr:ribosomal protein L11 methylase [Singulisphaera acidiphila DSM 18658]
MLPEPHSQHASEVGRGDRFEFGKNWANFLSVLDDRRIEQATRSLVTMLGVENLQGKSFLDVGSGSGLFSLAAMRLGATSVHSFDYDPHSIASTREVKRRYFPEAENWTIAQGSVLDRDYLGSLGTYDVVYSWGVLHHTGSMWEALGNVVPLVAPDGRLYIAIYNDQGALSKWWTFLKKTYNRLPRVAQGPFALLVMGPREVAMAGWYIVSGQPMRTIHAWTRYHEQAVNGRGMSRWHNIIDWIGGYPFEVATPEQIVQFYRDRGLVLESPMPPRHRKMGCNEFVLRHVLPSD